MNLRAIAQIARIARVPALAVALVVAGGLAAACGAVSEAPEGTPASPGLPVEMHVRWVVDSAWPATVTVHEPPAGQALYEVRTYEAGETPEVGSLIPDGVLRARYSEPRRFIAQVRNETDQAVRFWVAPHLPVPHVTEQGLMMFCLCTGEVYEVPAHGAWTRVMEFGVTRRSDLEGPIALTHVIVGGEIVVPTPAGDSGGGG